MKWLRHRFYQPTDDYRPIKWPPPGPYWCSGIRDSDDASVIVAYTKTPEQVTEFWPEAEDIDTQERDELTFTDRFARPDWWTDDIAENAT